MSRRNNNLLPCGNRVIGYGRKYSRGKAELCLRLADGLYLNNPGRFQLMDLAEDFLKRAKELEAQEKQKRQSKSDEAK